MTFHGWIAVPLETKAREFGINTSADSIECGKFVEVMFQILEFMEIPYEEFKEKCLLYEGKTVSEISEKIAFELYDDFKALI